MLLTSSTDFVTIRVTETSPLHIRLVCRVEVSLISCMSMTFVQDEGSALKSDPGAVGQNGRIPLVKHE
jgi:hypothetical protein